MKLRSLFAALALGASALCLYAEDGPKSSVIFTVEPEMYCRNCENKIKTNLRFEKGVTDITTDLSAKIVRVVFDTSKTSVEQIVAAFSKIGFNATPQNPSDSGVQKPE